jgi:hypothetical protein
MNADTPTHETPPDPQILQNLETKLQTMLQAAQSSNAQRVREMAEEVAGMTRQASKLPLPLSDDDLDRVGNIRELSRRVDLAMNANHQQVKHELRESSQTRRTLRAYGDSAPDQ